MEKPHNELEYAILSTLALIPIGQVSSYGKIAEKAGFKGRARYVGRILKDLPADSTIPWHRVVKSSGHLAFPEQDPRHERQVTLLESENIPVIGGKICMKKFSW